MPTLNLKQRKELLPIKTYKKKNQKRKITTEKERENNLVSQTTDNKREWKFRHPTKKLFKSLPSLPFLAENH